MRPHPVNSLNNFIAGWYLDDKSICDALIQYHKDSPAKREGIMAGRGGKVDKEAKDSIDVALPPSQLASAYLESLNRAADVVSQTQEKYIITGWFSTYTSEQYEKLRRRFGES